MLDYCDAEVRGGWRSLRSLDCGGVDDAGAAGTGTACYGVAYADYGCGMLCYDVVLTLTAAATIDCP